MVMTNTEGRINYTHPRRVRASVANAGPVVLQAGQTIWLTGPKAGLVKTKVDEVSADGKTISYRHPRR